MTGALQFVLILVAILMPIVLAIVLALRKKGKRARALQSFAEIRSYESIGSVRHTLGRIAKICDDGARIDRSITEKRGVTDIDLRIYQIMSELSDCDMLHWDSGSRRVRNLFRIPDEELEQIVFDYSWVSGGRTTVGFETTVTAFKSKGISALPLFDVYATRGDNSVSAGYVEFASHPEFSDRYSVFAHDEDDVSTIRRVFSPPVLDFLMKTDSLLVQCRQDRLVIHRPKGGAMTVSTLWPIETMDDDIRTTRRLVDLLLGK